MRIQLLFLILSSFVFGAEEPLTKELPQSLIIPDTCSLKISTPSFKDRAVVKVRLGNELEAYIVSDPQLKESALSLTVARGQWDDTTPGIAHFVEHMLFMGSEKYPTVDQFAQFVRDNGGSYNAFTSSTQTSYMFSVNNRAFDEAVDRLVDFFRSPLFKSEGIADERKAVDQEFTKSIDSDSMRLYMIEKQLANTDHPFARFGCGNSETLGKLTRQDVVSWYEKNYSSNIMRLTVYSPRPLAELKALVEKQFSSIPNRHFAPKHYPGPILAPERKGKMIYLPSRQESKNLQLCWEMPAHLANQAGHHTDDLLSRILSDEAPGSLLSTLKKSSLANAVSAGQWRLSQGSALFFIDVDLTDSGVQKHPEVLSIIFSHMAALRTEGIPRYLFEEMQTSYSLHYEYQTPQDGFRLAAHDAHNILYEEMSSFPEQASQAKAFDEERCKQLLKALHPRQCAISLIASTGLTGEVPSQKEKWTGAEYALKKIRPEQIRAWNEASPTESFALPVKNPYLPKSLPTIKQNTEASYKPKNIEDSSHGRFYYAPDVHFAIPKTSASFAIKTDKTDIRAPRAAAYITLLTEMLDDQTAKTTYLAAGADCKAQFSYSRGALCLTVSGWSPSIQPLVETQLTALKNLSVDRTHFARAKESALTRLRAAQKTSPLSAGMQVSRKILTDMYQPHEVERAMLPLQLDDFTRFYKNFLKHAHVESVICGALSPEESITIKDSALSLIGAKPLPKSDQRTQKALLLPNESSPLAVKQSFPLASNAALLHIQAADQTLENEVTQELLTNAIQPAFFEELRTNQQTGYVNYAFMSKYENVAVTTFAVQSASHSPEELVARYELFLEDYLRKINTHLSAERFETIRSSLIESYSKPPHTLDQMNAQIRVEAFDYCERFNLREEKIAYAKNLTHAEALQAAHKLFGRSNKRRLAILIQGNSSTPDMRYQMMKSPRHVQHSGALTSFMDAQIFTP